MDESGRASLLFTHHESILARFLVKVYTWEMIVMGALAALAARVAAQLGRGGIARRVGGALVPTGLGFGGFALGEQVLGNGDGMPRRRRRRKALTNDDVRTALTIASAISKKAAENFVLMRVRGQ